MLPMLELDTKYGLHEVFLNYFIPDNSKTGIFQSNVICSFDLNNIFYYYVGFLLLK